MRNPSDNWEELRQKVLGLGDSSVHKTHYPALKQRLEELEQMTQELKRSEAYLAEAQALSQTGSFGWKVATEEHIWSEQTYRIFEFDPADKPTMERILERVHPRGPRIHFRDAEAGNGHCPRLRLRAPSADARWTSQASPRVGEGDAGSIRRHRVRRRGDGHHRAQAGGPRPAEG